MAGVACLAATMDDTPELSFDSATRVWGAIHGVFVLLAAVGVSVGAVASTMYLIQARRLTPGGHFFRAVNPRTRMLRLPEPGIEMSRNWR